MKSIETDIVIVGSGPAGLSAAIAAKKQGAVRVHVIERLPYPGGLLFQCIHKGFGMRLFGEELTGPKYAERLIKEANEAGVTTLTSTFVTKIDTEDKQRQTLTVHALSRTGLCTFNAKAVIIATGCRERTIDSINASALSKMSDGSQCNAPLLTGTRPSGIFTAGTAQRMINIGGYHLGKRAVILGSGDIGLIMARRLTLTGTEVACIIEQSATCGGMAKNRKDCAEAFHIPFLTRHTITKIHGESHIEAVTAAEIDETNVTVPGSERIIECDTLILSVGLVPETDILTDFMKEIQSEDPPPNLIVCGNANIIQTMADDIANDGTIAGIKAFSKTRRQGRL